ncbi:enolase-phosphatase E1 [Brachionus plicatilis]|uniref:Enolase-phosphatase E1 n=1 Tax=Brachionus plicatilis TaxID=10195 RepID=A0A3M7T7K4_BRAPC|nr:enolase-phosphatase E1 [Brachionus plicatilis]
MSVKYKIGESVDTILTDIEGTTTSISFVKDILFPYIRSNLESYLTKNFDDDQCREDLRLLINQSRSDFLSFGHQVPQIKENFENKTELIESALANIKWQMDQDRKAKPLKQLQGHMWQLAYKNGTVKGHVYEDVVPAFERWISKGFKIYIYSSGSVEAQKLLFSYSDKGNLLKYFSGHFDTNVGLKTESQSYLNILNSLGKSGEKVLFLTDLVREAEAATQAGINVCVLRREDNPDKERKQFDCVNSFDEI